MDPSVLTNIGVVGAGSWGTALANLLGAKGYAVDLWVFETEVRDQIAELEGKPDVFAGLPLSGNIRPSNDSTGWSPARTWC